MTDSSEQRRSKRRSFFTGDREIVVRPPWSTEQSVKDNCTSCGACIEACPEGILVPGPAKTPIINFTENACSFCQKCVSVCDENVFSDVSDAPWALKANIQSNCMLKLGISCQICADACLDDALKFDMSQAPSGAMLIDQTACTGCGACLSVCPAGAIEFTSAHLEAEHA